jgi:hypothetical protein
MAYRKFDDKNRNVDDSAEKSQHGGFMREPERRTIQGIANQVLATTAGAVTLTAAKLGTSATGVCTQDPVFVKINGIGYTIGACSDVNLGTGAYAGANIAGDLGTMGTNCVCKFLVYAGTAGTTDVEVAGPGNIIEKKDYATAALAAAACKVPDLPDNKVALGYLLLQGPEATGVTFAVGGAGTMGTCTFVNYLNMPYTG